MILVLFFNYSFNRLKWINFCANLLSWTSSFGYFPDVLNLADDQVFGVFARI